MRHTALIFVGSVLTSLLVGCCDGGPNKSGPSASPTPLASDKSAAETAGPKAEPKAASDQKPAVDSKKSDDPQKWISLFDGKSLGKWKPTDFATQGKIDVKDQQIIIGFGDGCSGVTWTGEDFPKQDFEISLESQRVEGTDFFCGLTFPVRDSFCSFIVGGWGGGVVGISSIDGEDASQNDTTQYQSFDNGKWYTIRVRVTDKRIRCWIDDKKLVDEPIAERRLSVRSEVEASEPLGIAAYKTTAAERNIRYRKLTADEIEEMNK